MAQVGRLSNYPAGQVAWSAWGEAGSHQMEAYDL